jgi:hypothetical protein
MCRQHCHQQVLGLQYHQLYHLWYRLQYHSLGECQYHHLLVVLLHLPHLLSHQYLLQAQEMLLHPHLLWWCFRLPQHPLLGSRQLYLLHCRWVLQALVSPA